MNPIKNKKDLQSLIEELRNSAFNYLDNYSVSKQQVRIYLLKKFSKKNDLKVTRGELLDLIDVIEDCVGKKAIRNYMPMQKGDVYATWANTDLLKKLTGYSPKTDFKEGVKKFIEWYLEYYKKK